MAQDPTVYEFNALTSMEGLATDFARQRQLLVSNQALQQQQQLGIPGLGKGLGKKGKLGPALEKKVLPVEKDTEKLVSRVCGSNYFKEGEDVVLKADTEYPEWLWSLHTGKHPPLEEMDPGTVQYWRRLRLLGLRQQNQLRKGRKF